MEVAPRHLDTAELELHLPELESSPRDTGRLTAIVVRPAEGERINLSTAELSPDRGIEGDRWVDENESRQSQVSLMNSRILSLIAGAEEAVCLAGDNLIVDFDLSEKHLPAGSQLTVGDVVLEISDQPHTGCSKFEKRYGRPAREFVNNADGKRLHLRGRYGWVVRGGTIAIGDSVSKV